MNTHRRIFAGLTRFCGMPDVVWDNGDLRPISDMIERGELPLLLIRERDLHHLDPFLTEYHGAKGGRERVRATDEPIPTVDTSNRFGLTQSFLLPCTHAGDGARTNSVDKPLPTITTAHRGEMALAQTFLLPHQHGNDGPENVRGTDRPLPVVTGTSSDIAVAEPYIVPNFGERDGQPPRTHSVDDPLPAVTGHGAGQLAQPFLTALEHSTAASGHSRRVKSVDEPLGTVTTRAGWGITTPYLVKFYGGLHSAPIDDPLGTVTANYEHYGLAGAFLLPPEGIHRGNAPRDPDKPLQTITGRGGGNLVEFMVGAGGASGQQPAQNIEHPLGTILAADRRALIAPYLVVFRNNMDGASVDKPLGTVCTNAAHYGLAEPFLTNYNGTGVPHSVDEPLGTITTNDRFGLAEAGVEEAQVDGERLYMLDIRFRMLQPRELAAAHSYPARFVFSGSRDDQVKQIGNSVPVQLAKALCKAALSGIRPELQVQEVA